MPHNVMEQMELLSASPFHSIARVEVSISPNPNDREIYKVGATLIAGNWIDLYSLSKIALDRLMIAAGIEETDSTSRQVESNVWYSKWAGRYTQPDGKTVPLSGEKEIDLRIGGTRWAERKASELDSLLKNEGVKAGVFRKAGYSYKTTDKAAETVSTEHLVAFQVSLSSERVAELEKIAEIKATRFVVQQAQFGLERAQTGARLRAVRTIMQLGQYTLEDLKTPFVVIRSRYDIEKMQERIGPELLKDMLVAQAAQTLGLPDTVIAGLISAPSAQRREEANGYTGDTAEPDDVLDIDASIEEPNVGSEEDAPVEGDTKHFDEPATEETLLRLTELARRADFASLEGAVGYVFQKQTLTQGDALNLEVFFSEVLDAVANGEQINQVKAILAKDAREASSSRRLLEVAW